MLYRIQIILNRKLSIEKIVKEGIIAYLTCTMQYLHWHIERNLVKTLVTIAGYDMRFETGSLESRLTTRQSNLLAYNFCDKII